MSQTPSHAGVARGRVRNSTMANEIVRVRGAVRTAARLRITDQCGGAVAGEGHRGAEGPGAVRGVNATPGDHEAPPVNIVAAPKLFKLPKGSPTSVVRPSLESATEVPNDPASACGVSVVPADHEVPL